LEIMTDSTGVSSELYPGSGIDGQTTYLTDSSVPLRPITQRYLLIIWIDCYRDRQGRRYVDQLWYKDLVEHLQYLKNFALASPCRDQEPPEGAVPLDQNPIFETVEFVDLPPADSYLQAILRLPVTLYLLWTSIQQADVVHSAVAGSYIPPGWLVTPLVRWHRKFYFIIVESAFWRLRPGFPAKLKTRLKAWGFEQLNRWCLNSTDLAIFTQQEYLESLMTRHPDRGHIIHASWIDGNVVLSEAEARALWATKQKSSDGVFKLLFVGRLDPVKGISTLLEAIRILDQRKLPIQIDFLGTGELLDACKAVSQQVEPPTTVRILGTVPYGPELFQRLHPYQAVVVPSISDEQPRIIYDAYSQALPVLASNTAGLRDCVQQGKTGMLVQPGDASALATLLEWASQHRAELQEMGLTARNIASKMTHQEMHRRRWAILAHHLGEPSVVTNSPPLSRI
jgi:glycosyltransferase involved in cell wall biosynthesis